jgi:hypothetical protein
MSIALVGLPRRLCGDNFLIEPRVENGRTQLYVWCGDTNGYVCTIPAGRPDGSGAAATASPPGKGAAAEPPPPSTCESALAATAARAETAALRREQYALRLSTATEMAELRARLEALEAAATRRPGAHHDAAGAAAATTDPRGGVPPVAATAAASAAAAGAADSAAERACVVCLDAPRAAVLLPCGHLCACAACAAALTAPASDAGRRGCPICRAPLTGSVVPIDC